MERISKEWKRIYGPVIFLTEHLREKLIFFVENRSAKNYQEVASLAGKKTASVIELRVSFYYSFGKGSREH